MAKKQPTAVLLGFDDEIITEKYKTQLNFTVNKIGGQPDLPSNTKFETPFCPLCQLPRPLVVQIYAPLDNSIYHRTLYLFACINPNCSNQNESLLCVRIQREIEEVSTTTTGATMKVLPATDWCTDADDWDDADNNMNVNEENGNVISNVDNRVSDEDDESCSFEEALRSGFGNLTVDDRNANVGDQGGAVGRMHSPAATAEIEGNEGEVISIDTPTIPQHDLGALLHEVAPLPPDICQNLNTDQRKLSNHFEFTSYFISVWDETSTTTNPITDRHVRELLQEYQVKNDDSFNLINPEGGGGAAQAAPAEFEKYEKSQPAHGDKMFHHFLSKIQANPGQILRYSRDIEAPLLLQPLQEAPKKCQYCQSDVIFEFQLVPTLITKLKLVGDAKPCNRLVFGTILVFTCKKSCWDSTADKTMRIETVILQSEVY